MKQLGSSFCRINQSDVAASLLRAHLKSSEYSQRAAVRWLTEDVYSRKIQPLLAGMSTSAIASNIGVSRWYASRIRKGYRPHPRHWVMLAELAGFTS